MSRRTLPVLPALLVAGLLAPSTANAGIANDYYPVLNFLLNTAGFNCAQVANIADVRLGYTCTLTPIQTSFTGDLCIGALQNSCVLQSTDVGVDALVAGDLVITEFMQNPNAVTDNVGEWFEIYNNTADTVNLNGLVVSDLGSDSITVASDVSVAAGAYAVLGVSDDSATNGGVTVDYAYGSALGLANTSDELVLSFGSTTFDTIVWDDGATFPDGTGVSSSLDPASTDETLNDDGGNWCDATSTYGDGDLGTPGAVNDSCPRYTSADVQAILDVECAGCHTGGGASGGITWDDVNTNVDVIDRETGLAYIEPGSTKLSYMWHKLQGTQADVGGAGAQMPKGTAPMPQADLDLIEEWILDGAPE
jgi:hypothetical protein